MVTATNQYHPDYAVPPGWIIEERLAAQGISHAEFARRCGRSPKFISEIVAGKAPIAPKTALQFEKVLGLDASIWLGIEADYRLHGERQAEARTTEESAAWARTFPIGELTKRNSIGAPSSDGQSVSTLLTFFGVASISAWQVKYGKANIAYRHSPSFKSDESVLATWLRLAELDAERQRCTEYSESGFKQALEHVRRLTSAPVVQALEDTRSLLNDAGVALSLVKPLPKMRVSGAAWWLSPRRPVIALSARHKSDDHLWFSLFHEAAHLLLHSKKNVFVDGTDRNGDELENEANAWAAKSLLPLDAWNRFVVAGDYRAPTVRQFAQEQGIAPGVVVGKLQHERLLSWNRLNGLKVRLRWADSSSQ